MSTAKAFSSGVTKDKDGYWFNLKNSQTGPYKTKRNAETKLRRCLGILRNIGVRGV